MRISDWSSDVCSSDLVEPVAYPPLDEKLPQFQSAAPDGQPGEDQPSRPGCLCGQHSDATERRVGGEMPELVRPVVGKPGLRQARQHRYGNEAGGKYGPDDSPCEQFHAFVGALLPPLTHRTL